MSGDNSSVDVVRSIVAGHGPFDAVVLFIGGAQVPEAYGAVDLTLSAGTAVEAARALGDAPIAAIHQQGWAHFTSSPEDVVRAFTDAGLSHRLLPLSLGQEVPLR